MKQACNKCYPKENKHFSCKFHITLHVKNKIHMKKIFLTLTLASAVIFTAFAQEGKEQKTFAHEAGDMALVIDAAPFLQYAADLLNFNNGPAANAQAVQFKAYQANILGKYFINEKIAGRVRLGVSVHNYIDREFVDDNSNITDPTVQVEDTRESKFSSTELGLGAEYRLGDKRIQAYAGGELFFGGGRIRDNYTYGNAITSANQTPDDAFGATITMPYDGMNFRLLERKTDGILTYGVAGIVGVECFIMPQLSIGGEIRIEARATRYNKNYWSGEGWDTYTNSVREVTDIDAPKDFSFDLDEGFNNIGINTFGYRTAYGLNLTFYF